MLHFFHDNNRTKNPLTRPCRRKKMRYNFCSSDFKWKITLARQYRRSIPYEIPASHSNCSLWWNSTYYKQLLIEGLYLYIAWKFQVGTLVENITFFLNVYVWFGNDTLCYVVRKKGKNWWNVHIVSIYDKTHEILSENTSLLHLCLIS